MAVVCMSVNAQETSGSCGANATWEYDNGTLTISGTGAMADYTDALTDNPWNAYRTSITKVVIGNSITHIGNWAFMGCSALTEVTIGDHVTSIGAEAFANCLNEDFKYLAIPASVEEIGAFALSNISHLKYIACYANTAPTLGAEALTILNNLVAIYVPTAKVANYQAASGWSDLSAKITYPHGNCGDGEPATDAVTWAFDMASSTMTLIGTGAIKNFGYPGSYPWTNEVATGTFNPNGTGAYDYYWAGIQSLVIGEGITVIPDWSFAMQINLASISLPSTLKTIGESSLEEGAYTSITLPEGLETIGAYAFNNSKFSEITIPSTVTSIGASAFNYCTSLQTVTMFRNEPPTLGDKAFFNGDTEILPSLTAINVPAANVEDYKAADGWKDYKALIVAGGGAPATTTTFTYTALAKETRFDTYAKFTGATGVVSHDFADGAGTVVYEGTVTEIKGDAFRAVGGSNTNLTSITIPASVTTFASNAFRKSTALTTVNFAGTPTLSTVEDYVFADCSALTPFTIPASLTTIGDYMFEGCKAFTSFTIPATVTAIGSQAFGNCTNLASFNFAGTPIISSIGASAFYKCSALTAITLPESLTTIGGEVFNGAGITTLVIPKNVSSIGDGLTYACPITSLSVDAENATYDSRDGCNAVILTATDKLIAGCCNTIIPDGVKTIGTFAFAQFPGSFSLVIPESVTTFELGAIHMCTGLKAVTIPSGITSIDMTTFGGCMAVTDVYCYASPTIIWEEPSMSFADGKATRFHVAAAALSTWESNFSTANVTFVGDLGAMPANNVDGTYWATYYNGSINMKVDANTTVYKAAINGSTITLTEIDDKVITARQAVILKSTGASIAMTPQAAASADDYSGNVLEGVDAATDVDANYKYYVLSNENSTLGFYKFKGATLGANKAFYKTNATDAPEFFAFGETTGIGASLVNSEQRTVNSVYNLAGQRVAQPTKGLYIVNGKKVVIK